MTPAATTEQVRARMQRQASRDTHVELELRRALRGVGVGYRTHFPIRVPGHPRLIRADVALPGARLALFADGCWWHMCPRHWRRPESHGDWWQAKCARNAERDGFQSVALADAGWTVVRVWECAVRGGVPAPLVEFVVNVRDYARETGRAEPRSGIVMEMGERLGVRVVRRVS